MHVVQGQKKQGSYRKITLLFRSDERTSSLRYGSRCEPLHYLAVVVKPAFWSQAQKAQLW